MNIAIDCRMIGSGGIGSYISSLLPFFIQKNKCLLIGRLEDIEKYKDTQNVELLECNIPTFSIKEMIAFPKALSKKINTCDIYYTPYCNIPCGIKIPVCSTIHDVVFLDIPELAGKLGTMVRKFFYKYACWNSDIIFTVSQFSKDRILYHLKTKKPVVITYTAVPEWLNSEKKIAKEDMILFVGNIKRHKGLHTLLPAFKLAKDNGLNAKLVIVGNADNFRTADKTISNEISSFPDGWIEFTGRISDESLKELYQKAKLLVQPSLYEGFGLPPLEALQAGTNVVLSDIPVFKEVYKDYPVNFFKTEDIQDLSQKILDAYKQPDPTNIPEHYTFEKTYNVIINTLKSIIK